MLKKTISESALLQKNQARIQLVKKNGQLGSAQLVKIQLRYITIIYGTLRIYC